MEMLPCFTPREMEELGLGENGFYIPNPNFDPKIFFEFYKNFGMVVDNYEDLVKDSIKEYIGAVANSGNVELCKQKILELGWNPEIVDTELNEEVIECVTAMTRPKLSREGYSINIDMLDETRQSDAILVITDPANTKVEAAYLLKREAAIDDEQYQYTINLYTEGVKVVKKYIYDIYYNLPGGNNIDVSISSEDNYYVNNNSLVFGEARIEGENNIDRIKDMVEKANVDLVSNGFTTIHVVILPYDGDTVKDETKVLLAMENYMESGYQIFSTNEAVKAEIIEDLQTDNPNNANVIVSSEEVPKDEDE